MMTIEEFNRSVERFARKASAPGAVSPSKEQPRETEAHDGKKPGEFAPWHEDVVQMAHEQRAKNPFKRMTFPEVMAKLKEKHPQLTMSQFHDGLRDLHDQGKIRLGAYTQALAQMEEARNAMFLDREVKFYVEPPR